jgi:hypothetical protein
LKHHEKIMEIINPAEPNMVFHPSSLDSATFFVVIAMAPLGAGALPLLEAVGKWFVTAQGT